MSRSNVAIAIAMLSLLISAGPWIGGRFAALRSRVMDDPIRLSFFALAVDSERYDGALLFLNGACRVQFEGTAIYEDLEHAVSATRPAIWIDLPTDQFNAHESSTAEECAVSGRFRAGPGGHMSRFDGELIDLRFFQVYAHAPDAA